LTYCNVHLAFKRIVKHAGLAPRSTVCRPRPHDLRHTFAVNTLLDAYRHDIGDGEHIQARIALLCTYLGHVNPGSTYWYLQAAPELLALAAERLERVEEAAR
jgi:integrase